MAKAAGLLDRVQGRMEEFFAPESGMGVPNLPPAEAGMLPGQGAPNLGALPQAGMEGMEGMMGEVPEAAGPAVPAPTPESTLGGLTEDQAPPELGNITLSELLSLGFNSFLEQLLLQPTGVGGVNAESTGATAQGPSPQEGLQGPTG